MTVTITNNMALISGCESTTGWTPTPNSTYTGFQREGTNCVGDQASSGTYHSYFTISSTDYSNRTIFVWMRSGNPTPQSTGGFRIILGDTTNRRAYYVGGSDNYGLFYNGWSCFKLDTSNLPTAYATLLGSSAPNIAAITQIGVGFNYASKATGTVDNVFWDCLRWISNSASALNVGGGGVGTEGTFTECITEDESTSNAWGIFSRAVPGTKACIINFGVAIGNSASASSYFKVNSAQLYLNGKASGMDQASGAMNITLLGNSTGTNLFELDNCVLVNVGSVSNFSLSNTNVNTMKITNSQFMNCGTFACPTSNANKYITGTIFDACGKVTSSTMKFESNDIRNSTDGILISSPSHEVQMCNFINLTNGIEISVADTYALADCVFDTVTYHINNTSGGAVIVNNTGTTNASTYTGDTTINSSYPITITIKDKNTQAIIEGVQTSVFLLNSPYTQLMNEDTDEYGIAYETYGGSVPVDVVVKARKSDDLDSPRYKPDATIQQITSDGLALTMSLVPNPVLS